MSGGLLNFACFGSQSVQITGSPQQTIWRNVYRRHTNYACQSLESALKPLLRRRTGDFLSDCHVKWQEAWAIEHLSASEVRRRFSLDFCHVLRPCLLRAFVSLNREKFLRFLEVDLKRLEWQLCNSRNVLTEALPQELIAHLWKHMVWNVRGSGYLSPDKVIARMKQWASGARDRVRLRDLSALPHLYSENFDN